MADEYSDIRAPYHTNIVIHCQDVQDQNRFIQKSVSRRQDIPLPEERREERKVTHILQVSNL